MCSLLCLNIFLEKWIWFFCETRRNPQTHTHTQTRRFRTKMRLEREGGGECGSRDCGWDEGDEMSSGSNVGWPKSNYPAVHRVSNRWKRRQHAPSTSFFTTCLSLVCQCVCLLKPFGRFIQIFLNNLNESTKVSPGLIWIKFDINSVNHRNSIKFYSQVESNTLIINI